MFDKNTKNVLFFNLFFACVRASGFRGDTQDINTPRTNTLSDDADDIQRQLDNEARDRIKFGKSKTIWVFHFPTQFPGISTEAYRPRRSFNLIRSPVTDKTWATTFFSVNDNNWEYKDQHNWGSRFPNCKGRYQSPVDLPYEGMPKVTGARKMFFSNHDVTPESLCLSNDGKCVKISGMWPPSKRPVIYGGAVHSRRYVFDSIILHWPSEHTIGGLHYPIESQVFYISAEYASLKEALNASNDQMALLAVTSLYKYSNHTHKGLRQLLRAVLSTNFGSKSINLQPLSFFNPPMKEYVCYQGSLTTPPCTESVVWLVRARSLPVTRELVKTVQNVLVNGERQEQTIRQSQPLNDRKIYFFN